MTVDAPGRLKRLYDAFNRRDWDGAFNLVAPDFTWTFDPNGFLTGTYSGRDAIRRAIEDFLDVWEDFHVEVDALLELDADHIGVEGRVVGRGTGSDLPIELTETVVWRFRNDELVEAKEYLGTPRELRARLEDEFSSQARPLDARAPANLDLKGGTGR